MRECECLTAHWLQFIILWSVEEGTCRGRRGEHPSLLAQSFNPAMVLLL